MISLDKYLTQLDDEEAREEAISDLSVSIAEVIKRNGFYQPGLCQDIPGKTLDIKKSYWHMDDFTGDVYIDNTNMTAMLNDSPKAMMEDIQEKFEKWCDEIAEESIDEEWRLANEQ